MLLGKTPVASYEFSVLRSQIRPPGNPVRHSLPRFLSGIISLYHIRSPAKDLALHAWSQGTLKSLILPGGVLLLVAVGLLQDGFLSLSAAAVQFYYFAAFAGGILLAWRFEASRILMALVTLLLADRALGFFAAGHGVFSGPGRAAFEAVALLLPLNFILLALVRERGLIFPAIAAGLGWLFFESVLVAVVARPETQAGPAFLHPSFVDHHFFAWTKIPQLAWLAFAAAFAVSLIRFLRSRKPAESGLLWALVAAGLALQTGAVGRIPSAYLATGALILAGAIVETSYLMAFHDELTALPARRAFHQALLHLPESYAVAVVDIDHFKSFNDSYGHETGDQVLQLVAARLARVRGGGQAFRVGGEEFAILFSGKSAKQAAAHLESLRAEIQGSTFRVRSGRERRTASRGPDRRQAAGQRKKARPSEAMKPSSSGLVSVTVSIGAAEPNPRLRDADEVIRAADQALYRAKQSGRNRVEIATPSRTRGARAARRSIA